MTSVQVKAELPFDELLKAVEQLSLADLEQLMSQVAALQAQRKAPRLSKPEAELLLQINRGLPRDVQQRFSELVARRQAETLTPDEHHELVRLTDQIEQTDALRIESLAELALLRGVTLTAVMEALGIRPPTHG